MRPSSRVRAIFAPVCLALLIGACGSDQPEPSSESASTEDLARAAMIRTQIAECGVESEAVLKAMGEVPRHEFVPADQREHAYEDRALPIGHGQSTSRPSLVAIMTELAELKPGSRVLEVGTGSGYAAAVLSRIAAEVYTIEIVEDLATRAAGTLKRLGYDNVFVRAGDGYRGWPDKGPFDAIIVTAAPPEVPEPLRAQLKVGGNLVVPVGTKHQSLRVIHRTEEGYEDRPLFRVNFVEMAGEAQGED